MKSGRAPASGAGGVGIGARRTGGEYFSEAHPPFGEHSQTTPTPSFEQQKRPPPPQSGGGAAMKT
ncbi:hypothetical protein HanRHA438_Chr09g0387961 [Helianthus annuus]|nr:hypothetical protein HanIR_Chr09g0405721 [Helianthus annuus]KAJ0541546.1 hypothetical protein HanHA89_Chr09g0329661 [Helianthus annuus]KAJ0706621.1 hypothetical protein HanLR1_Chr09g0309101 [Helianthus annuus]KAJ0752569.1 hypothetical protein HanPI659440_Chr09g0325891 [Helianthus annuus]KAJ0887193.1 hypothetical protein HanRHA438_Chr09g0387961 [Helianthus annuus]